MPALFRPLLPLLSGALFAACSTAGDGPNTLTSSVSTVSTSAGSASSGSSTDSTSSTSSGGTGGSGGSAPGDLRASVPQGYFQLAAPLDEPEFYCLDIPGVGESLKLDSPLMMHTCKRVKQPGSGDDELFAWNEPESGQIHAYKYDRCAEASEASEGSTVVLKACADLAMQKWEITTVGQIRLTGSSVCMAAASDDGTMAGGQSNLRRNMRLQDCATVDPELATWTFPGT